MVLPATTDDGTVVVVVEDEVEEVVAALELADAEVEGALSFAPELPEHAALSVAQARTVTEIRPHIGSTRLHLEPKSCLQEANGFPPAAPV
jgi:hypothetical protein